MNRTALEMAKPGKGQLFVYNILDQKPSLLGRYDAVFLLDVIEHIDDDTAFLRAALRHLQSGLYRFGQTDAHWQRNFCGR